jgi:cytochrome c551/c552
MQMQSYGAGGSMKVLLAQRKRVVALLLVAAILLISCAPNANEPIISSQLGAILAAREAGEEVSALPTPTPVLITTLSEEQVYSGLPEDVTAALTSADPARAEQLVLVNACSGCHSLDPNVALAGPSWYHVADTAAGRVPGESPALYLYESITDPSKYIVPGFQDGVMPQDFGQRLSTQDLADLVAYLLEQHQ